MSLISWAIDIYVNPIELFSPLYDLLETRQNPLFPASLLSTNGFTISTDLRNNNKVDKVPQYHSFNFSVSLETCR